MLAGLRTLVFAAAELVLAGLRTYVFVAAEAMLVRLMTLAAVLVGLFVYWFKAAVLQASGSRLHAFELLLGYFGPSLLSFSGVPYGLLVFYFIFALF